MAENPIRPAPEGRRRKRLWLRLALGLVLGIGLSLATFVWWMHPHTRSVAHDLTLPVRYDEDRFFAEPIAANGATLSLLTDTGGGLFLRTAALARVGGAPTRIFGRTLSRLPAFKPDASIPEPSGGGRWMPIWDEDDTAGLVPNGMLGQRWFAGGIWTFDYAARSLLLRATPFQPSPFMSQHSVPLGFPSSWGVRKGHHPRFAVSVAGQRIEALLDTGATAWLSPTALETINDGGRSERATSFVAAALYDRWHSAHSDWRIIPGGCAKTHADMIEVPEVEVAGLKAGPVWFTRRSDATYVWMSSFMDQPIAASVGGNFFRHFRVTVDYPSAVAYFELPTP